MPAPAKLQPICLDFETDPIEGRPHYPPRPVSFSLQLPEWRTPRFYAWGHYTGGNNCSLEDAQRLLRAVYAEVSEVRPLVCHNAKFDLDVAEVHMGCPLPPWHCWHDTMILLFLVDPHARQLGLKPAAERRLGMKPDEQDAVKHWVLEHKRQLEADFPAVLQHNVDPKTGKGGIKPGNAGAYVAWVPGEVAGPYANGDVVRTKGLFTPLLKEVTERGMLAAYNRERQVLPILLRNEREGIRTDESLLNEHQDVYTKAQAKCDDWLRKALKAPGLDFNKDRAVGDALDARGAVREWTYTKTGQRSVSKQNLKLSHFADQKVAAALSYRNRLDTILGTFIRPWLHYSSGGRMHTNWNQVRQAKSDKGGDTGGTRTGRPSSDSPNFLNMPKKVSEDNALAQYKFPAHINGLPDLPKVRDYILPDEKGHVLGRRDYNQQELRILAHFEDGELLQGYLTNPRLDVHHFLMTKIITEIGLPIERKEAKEMNFGYIYGQGIPSLAAKMERPVDVVKRFRDAQMAAIPGMKSLLESIKARVKAEQPIVTWGGREYFCEEPVWWEDGKRWITFDYKLLNYLIQGSAADVTKESLIRYDAVRKEGRFALTVYDENNISVPRKALKSEMLILREAMMSIELDVPLMSDGEWGERLGSMEPLKEAAPSLSRWGIAS